MNNEFDQFFPAINQQCKDIYNQIFCSKAFLNKRMNCQTLTNFIELQMVNYFGQKALFGIFELWAYSRLIHTILDIL